jgi:predicted aspartyl protease
VFNYIRKTLLLFLACLIVSFPCFAAPLTEADIPAKTDIVVTDGKNETTIPFESLGNLIIVKVTLNHRREYRFMVDTGASTVVIEAKLILT